MLQPAGLIQSISFNDLPYIFALNMNQIKDDLGLRAMSADFQLASGGHIDHNRTDCFGGTAEKPFKNGSGYSA